MIELDKNTGMVLLALVVVASGCAQGGNTETAASTQAVQVLNYSAVPSTVYDSQQVSLRMRLKNVGGSMARDVKVKVSDAPGLSEGSNANPGSGEWRIESVNPTSRENAENVIEVGELRPADQESGIPATPREALMTLTPPDLSDNRVFTYNFLARVAFGYTNRASTDVKLMGERRRRESNVQMTQPTVENSDGPIQIDIRTITPIVFYGEGESTNRNLCVIVRNEGEGTPFLGNVNTTPAEDNLDTVQLTMNATGGIGFETLNGEDSQKVKVDLTANKGSECFRFTNLQQEFNTNNIEKTVPITLEADYNYYKETQTSVTVKGRP